MQRSRILLALAAAAVFAASTTLAAAGESPQMPRHQVVVQKVAGPGENAFFVGLPGEGFHWRGTMLGVAFVPLTPELREHFGAPRDSGVLVSKVVADSAAQAAGIQVGDIITRVDDKAVGEEIDLGQAIRNRKPGDTVSLEVLRDGKTQVLSATLEASEAPPMLAHKMVMMQCKDENGAEKDCPEPVFLHDLDCDGGRCEVRVTCNDGACTCNVNGEDKPCPEGIGEGAGK